jgi:hypothetical protein
VGETGPACFKRLGTTRDASFTNITLIADKIIAAGERVLMTWTFSDMHTGSFAGLPAF